jgi:hypothetical protein
MGNSNSAELNHENVNTPVINKQYDSKYNLVPSLPGHEYESITFSFLKKKYDIDDNKELDKYVDLRNNFPNIINISNIPLNPIACVSYVLHYSLLKNNLPIFPPSLMYIFNNIQYYPNISSIMCFDTIFQSILDNGFCSENDMRTIESNIGVLSSDTSREKALAFKFINVYKVENKLETIKHLIKNKYPILIGFTIYYPLSNIDNFMWLPDKTQDKKIGGLAGVIVGYIDDRKMFIVAQTFGENFANSGYVLIPYDYVMNENYTFEKYIIDFKPDRVNGYISQRRAMVNLEKTPNIENNNQYRKNMFDNLFT